MNPDNANQPNEQPAAPPQEPVAPPQPIQSAQPPTQPTPFAQPPQPPMSPGYPVPMTSGGGNRNKLLLIIGAIVGGLVLLGVLVAAMVMMTGVSKQDYQNAYEKAGDLSKAYSKETSVYVSEYSSESEITNETDTLKSAHKDFVSSYNQLKGMKAVTNDKEAKKAFDALEAKYKDYEANYQAKIEAYEQIMPLLTKMGNTSPSSPDEAMSLLKSLQSDLDKTNLSVDVNKTYVNSLKTHLATLIDLGDKVIAMRAARQYDSSLVNQYYDATDTLSDDSKDWESNLKKLEDKANISDEAYKLSRVLLDKYTKSK